MENIEIINNNSPVVEFYSGKTVFITGATGFMGKVLVEKLLRSTDVKMIYLLIRPKKGVQTELRLKALLESSVFERLKEMDAESHKRFFLRMSTLSFTPQPQSDLTKT